MLLKMLQHGNGLTDESIRLVSGGTDNHLMLVDLSATETTGKDGRGTDRAAITVNKIISFDTKSSFVTSVFELKPLP